MTTSSLHPATGSELDARAVAARDWACERLDLARPELTPPVFAPASADASFRRYFRVEHGSDSWVVMDAPPEREDLEPFVRIAGLMRDAGLHVPRILAEDRKRGYLLLSDLGRQTYLQAIDDGNADELIGYAIDALILWQRASRPGMLPSYDAALLQRELDLFPDWYVARHLQVRLNADQQKLWGSICALLVASALEQPQVYVHRDYMPRNLMRSDPEPGVLDFQDAVEGPISYDVISLVRDAFRSWSDAQVERWLMRYWTDARAAGLPLPADAAEFRRAADWMGLQRHLKVIGIFARINYRDGKPHYLADVPRFIGYVRKVAARYPETAPLLALFDQLGMA